MMEGRVKFFNSERGYGFIGTEYSGDFFFHVSQFRGMDIPEVGQYVRFEQQAPKKPGGRPSAVNIQVVQRMSSKPEGPLTSTTKPERTYTGQYSQCNACGSKIEAYKVVGDRAFYRCTCGKRWSGRAYLGRHVPEGRAVVGGAIAGAVVGGPLGAVVGSVLGMFVGKTSKCMKCGGTGKPTGSRGNKTMFQCKNCKSTWIERR